MEQRAVQWDLRAVQRAVRRPWAAAQVLCSVVARVPAGRVGQPAGPVAARRATQGVIAVFSTRKVKKDFFEGMAPVFWSNADLLAPRVLI